MLRVATWNVHKCQGLDRRVSTSRIAEVIDEVSPAIVGIQEVFEEQAEAIARSTGMHVTMAGVRLLHGCQYGNATLSRIAPLATRTWELSVTGREPRGCLQSDFPLDNAVTLHHFNAHFGTGFLERRRQARLIEETGLWRAKDLTGPRILAGDFNEWTHGLISRVLAREFRGADIRLHLKDRRTYPGILPVLHLDHIYYDESLILHRVALHRTRKALIASDHLPLYADFTLAQS